MKTKKARLVPIALSVAAVVAVTMSLGCIEELQNLFGGNSGGQHWVETENDVTMDFSWGLAKQGGGAIYSPGYGTMQPPCKVWVDGTVLVSGAQSCAATATIDLYITKVGVDSPLSSDFDMSPFTISMTGASGSWSGAVQREFTQLDYSDFGLSTVGSMNDIECRVQVTVTVDGTVRTVKSNSASAGYTLHVERTSDACVFLSWKCTEIYT